MKNILAFALLLTLAACSSNPKTLVVMSKGKAEVDLNAQTIKATDGSGHEEQTINLSQEPAIFQLNTPAGEAKVELKGTGLYVVNVKNDTIIGAYQNYTSAEKAQNMISQEALKTKTDSLKQLVEGKNVSAANRNYYILPNQVAKISENPAAQVVGPYHRMRSAERVDGKDPEIYRFYSIKEIREMISKLEKLQAPSSAQ
ncbi:MAG: hypothetical protein EAZ62_04335 [Sphingobacteriia bacterium]|nr:MAG: hypothetical protein EAZ62_04335 [Sphingobacteriia bacterium]